MFYTPNMTEDAIFNFFPAFFISFWVLISYGLSRSGWSALADKYPASDVRPPKLHNFCSLILNQWISYNSCLRMGFTENALYIRPLWMFRLFHPPLLIPFKDLHEVNKNWWIFYRVYGVGSPSITEIGFAPPMNLRLQEKFYSRNKTQGT